MQKRRLKSDLALTRPFNTLAEEVLMGLIRTTWQVTSRVNTVYASAGLTPSQYNVLRILRGSLGGPLSCTEIGERMVTRDSDLTRILDGLKRRCLISRRRSKKDGRRIENHLADAGLALLATLDRPLVAIVGEQFDHLGPDQLERLADLLEAVRR